MGVLFDVVKPEMAEAAAVTRDSQSRYALIETPILATDESVPYIGT